MKKKAFKKRVAEVMREELETPEHWLFFSFADEVFRGAVIIKAHGITDGLLKINALNCNPHGQVLCNPIIDEAVPPEKYRNRLLTKAEILEFWPDSKTIREHEEGEA